MVITNGGQCSKHFYIGSQRVVSKLCNAGTISNPLTMTRNSYSGDTVDFSAKFANLTDKIKTRYDSLGVTYRGTDHADTSFYKKAFVSNENQQYFYHSDHLGSSSLIANLGGDIVQHIEYVPFGEVFIEESKSTWNTPYKFNAKELDEETGLYYYGARYYDPRTSVWLSVDPLGEERPWESPYSFCGNNPLNRIDLSGMKWDDETQKNDLVNDIKNEKVRLIHTKESYENGLKDPKISDKQRSEYQHIINMTDERVKELDLSLDDIEKLGADQKNVYTINNSVSSKNANVTKRNDNKISINAKSKDLQIHEIRHISISLTKNGLKFDKNNRLGYSSNDNNEMTKEELSAYKAQYSFCVPRINGRDLQTPTEVTKDVIKYFRDPTTGKFLYPFMLNKK